MEGCPQVEIRKPVHYISFKVGQEPVFVFLHEKEADALRDISGGDAITLEGLSRDKSRLTHGLSKLVGLLVRANEEETGVPEQKIFDGIKCLEPANLPDDGDGDRSWTMLKEEIFSLPPFHHYLQQLWVREIIYDPASPRLEVVKRALLFSCLRMIRQIASKFPGLGLDLGDFVGVGVLGFYAALEGYDPTKRGLFTSYLWRVCQNRMLNAKWRQHDGVCITSIDGPFGELLGDTGCEDPSELVMRQERSAIVNRLLTQEDEEGNPVLSERDKQMLAQRYVNGLTLQEIGDFFGLTRAAVSLAIKKAIDRMCSF